MNVNSMPGRTYRPTFTQESLWLLHQVANSAGPVGVYNEPVAFQIAGPVNVSVLAAAVERLVLRHDALRSRFEETPDGLAAVVVDDPPPVVRQMDLRHLPAEAASNHAKTSIQDDYMRPFDLASGSLLRALIIRTGEEETYLALTAHHLAIDGWSLGLLLDEIGKDYRALCATGKPALDATSTVSFRGYAATVRGGAASGDFDHSLAFWKAHHTDGLELLKLPLDFRRPPVQGFRGSSCALRVKRDLVTALTTRYSGATEYSTVLAAYAVLLGKYAAQESVTIGTTLLNRTSAREMRLVGCLVNTAALVVDLDPKASFGSLLAKTTNLCQDAVQHQSAPYPMVMAQSSHSRDASYNPIFQTMLTYLGDQPTLDVDGASVEWLPVRRRAARFDLMMYVTRVGEFLELELEYNTDLFRAETAQRVLAHFVRLLKELARLGDVPISRVNFLLPEELSLLESWNDTKVQLPSTTVVEAFTRQARKTPDAIAVRFGEKTLTYRELRDASLRVAGEILRMVRAKEASEPHILDPAREHRFVGVCLQRSDQMVIALLAILTAGCAYVPIDPEYPVERIHFMIEDADPVVVITEPELMPLIEGSPADRLLVPLIDTATNGCPDVPLSALDDPAYMIYTSGSTGRPKGVVNLHSGLANRLHWMQAEYGLTSDDRVLQKTPFGFDVSVWEFFWPLMYGACLVVAEPGVHRDPSRLRTLIDNKKITTIHFVPSMLNAFLEVEGANLGCASLRRVFCSGEALSPRTASTFQSLLSCGLHNLYGPTEAAIDVSYWACSTPRSDGIVPIGRPIANVTLHVVDEHLALQPIGVPGELCIGGVAPAQGYHNRAELNRRSFVPDPFAGSPRGRLYRTGDLCRRLADGTIEYLGRMDGQVKLRGLRIELGEIEVAVRDLPHVSDAAVVVHPTAGGGMLTAYVVGSGFDPDRAAEVLRSRLPAFMVPPVFVPMIRLPLTPNGKLDRRALPDPNGAGSAAERTGAAQEAATAPALPAGLGNAATRDVTELVSRVWCEVLGVSQVDAADHFFALGGDSMIGIRVVASLRAAGCAVEVADIFASPTLGSLASVIESRMEAACATDAPKTSQREPYHLMKATDRDLLPPGVEDAWPVTRLQAGMIYHSMLRPEATVYHDVFSFELAGDISPDPFRTAVEHLFGKHPQLRSRFDFGTYSEPMQLIESSVVVPCEVLRLDNRTDAERDRAIRQWMREEHSRGFDFTTPPLLRVALHLRSAERAVLTLSFHHAILDGWSIATLVDELCVTYSRLLHGDGLDQLEEPVSYSAYVELERQALVDPAHDAFWRGRLVGVPASLLLGETLAPQVSETSPARGRRSEQRVLPRDVTTRVADCARAVVVPAKSVYVAAHAAVLGQLLGRPDVVTGLVVNGRPEEQNSEKTLGLFLNVLPFPITDTGSDLSDLITRCSEAEAASLRYRRLPLSEIQQRTSRGAMFDTLFNYTDFHVRVGSVEDDGSIRVVSASYFEQTNFPVVVHLHHDRFTANITVIMDYDADRVDEALVTRYLDGYVRVLSEVSGDPRIVRATAAITTKAPRESGDESLTDMLCSTIADVLGLPAVHPDDDYLRLGVDSITAIQIIARARRSGVALDIEDIFSARSPRELCTVTIATSGQRAEPPKTGGSPDTGRDDMYPATSMQKRMLEEGAEEPQRCVYHDVFSYRLGLPLDPVALEQVLRQVVHEHEILRTSFQADAAGDLWQHVSPVAQPRLEVVDLRTCAPADQQRMFDDWFAIERATPFDPREPGLLRFAAHWLDHEEFILTISFHHAVLDGWSLSRLVQSILEAHEHGKGNPAARRQARLRYRDYVMRERAAAGSAASRMYWRELLDGCRPTLLASSRRPRALGVEDAPWSEAVSEPGPAVEQRLDTVAQRIGVPRKHILLAAHLELVRRLTGETDVLTGVFANGRLEEESGEEMVGLFLNYLPFRQTRASGSYDVLIKEVFEQDLRSMPHRRFPTREIELAQGDGRLFDTAFNYTRFKAYATLARPLVGHCVKPVLRDVRWFEHTEFSLLSNIGHDITGRHLRFTLNARCDVFDQSELADVSQRYTNILKEMLELR